MKKDKLINLRVTSQDREVLKQEATKCKLTLTQLLLKPFKKLLRNSALG